jgi:hypothetical protein
LRQESEAVLLVVRLSAQPVGQDNLGMWPSAASSLAQDCVTPNTAHCLVLWNGLNVGLFELCIVTRFVNFLASGMNMHCRE